MTKEKYFQTSLHIFYNIDTHFLHHIFLNPYTFKYPSLNTWHTSNIENLEIEQKLKKSIQQEWQFESSLWINDFDRSMTKRKILDDTFRKRPTLETTMGIFEIAVKMQFWSTSCLRIKRCTRIKHTYTIIVTCILHKS